jgi:hypothetical protein
MLQRSTRKGAMARIKHIAVSAVDKPARHQAATRQRLSGLNYLAAHMVQMPRCR